MLPRVTPVGPGIVTLVPPTRTVQATIGGGLGIYPGQWAKLLSPAAIQPTVSIADNETAVDQNKTQYNRIYRFNHRTVSAGGARLDLKFVPTPSSFCDRARPPQNAIQTLLQNRIVYRPAYYSPITLRLNYQDTRSLNDPTLGGPAGSWADQTLYQGILQWLMRWNRVLTTLSTYTFDITDTSDFRNKDPNTLVVTGTTTGSTRPARRSNFASTRCKRPQRCISMNAMACFAGLVMVRVRAARLATTLPSAAFGAWVTRSTSTVASNMTAFTAFCRAARPGTPAQ